MTGGNLMRNVGERMGWPDKVTRRYATLLDKIDSGELCQAKVERRLLKIMAAPTTAEVERQLGKALRGK
jgi:hypothetical protein